MPNIKIKQLDSRIATAGLHMGGDNRRRKLQPGEIVEIPEDLLVGGVNLFDALYATGKVEITNEDANRPLDYDTDKEASLCSPTYRTRGVDDEKEVEKTVKKAKEKLAKKAGKREKPAEGEVNTPRKRGAVRNRSVGDSVHGAQVST